MQELPEEDATLLAAAMIPVSKDSKDHIWEEAARASLTAMIVLGRRDAKRKLHPLVLDPKGEIAANRGKK